jgi:CRISPR-associated endonuclease Csn1
MEKVLGLDLGTNSIGWAVINRNENKKLEGIEAAGVRIIPMDASIMGDFDKGNSVSQTADRRGFRGTRHLRERHLLRRERLHRVLSLMNFLPNHYAENLDRYGKLTTDTEPKLPWKKNLQGKYEFIFQDSFNEMLEDFKKEQPSIAVKGVKIPYDWTIYYLRKKALSKRITKEELSWIILNFNQKRGYYQLRGEDEGTDTSKLIEYYSLKVVSVEDSGEKKGDDIWYNVKLENGWVYRRSNRYPLDWVGKTKDFIVTTDLDGNGIPKKDKDGNTKRSFRAPKEDDWTLLKKKTEADIEHSHKSVGEYIYDSLLENPNKKIRGKLIRTIERKYYKEELRQILEKQTAYHIELQDKNLYLACINELYPNNESYRKSIEKFDFIYLFIDNIIFYQRPLKSKKSLIANCPYEQRVYIDKKSKEKISVPIKCIPKSHPLFQEFRLWQFISNLEILQRERVTKTSDGQLPLFPSDDTTSQKIEIDAKVTKEFLPDDEAYADLFDWLNDREEITQNTLLGSYFKIKKPKGKDEDYPYRWNNVEDKKYPCNQTRGMILSRLEKANIKADFLTKENELALWHILYSISDKQELKQALISFAETHQLGSKFVDIFQKFPPFDKEYGAYSAKAIKKLLPLMRMGRYWTEEAIDKNTKSRIDKILTGEYDESIRERVRQKAINLTDISHFKRLPIWLACYIVYDRHSESKDIYKWESPSDIDSYLMSFKQYSLHNPIVEQVILETLRTVRDIWKQVGHIDEIHIELGRNLKNPKDKRMKITEQISDNENANLRIKAMLSEFINPDFQIKGVRPYSTSQQDILRIYEDGVLKSVAEIPEEIKAIINKFNENGAEKRPTHAEVLRYKLWLDQKYQSPYTGEFIPLSELFTSDYEIEHIIPQSRYFDDSFSNKVICEAEVNKLKGNDLGYEFIKKQYGRIVETRDGKHVKISSIEAYEKFVNDHYSRNYVKKRKLLMEDIPDDFINRQLNDSRYISKVIKSLLSNIVREKDEQEDISKNVIPCSGAITDYLKKDWGMNDVWNSIVLPRFERLNQMTGTTEFTTEANGHTIPSLPLDLQKGFSKKRIDHRHHAMDAIVIACATRSHVNLLNNEAARSENKANRYQLSRKLRHYEKVMINGQEREVAKEFLKPWNTFTQDARNTLNNIVVNFKHNLRVINKTSNYYQYIKDGKKKYKKQERGDSWAIRKPMHKETVFGLVNLRSIKEARLTEALKRPQSIADKDLKEKVKELLSENFNENRIIKYFNDNKEIWQDINLSKIKVYYFSNEIGTTFYATRFGKDLVSIFKDAKNKDKALNVINSITDTGIQEILKNHLKEMNDDPILAFSADGIEKMNSNIQQLNGGKEHKPIYKVRTYEMANKYTIGQKGNKSKKFVEAAKGTNLFFAIYESIVIDKETGIEKKTRNYFTIPLNVVIDRLKNGLSPVPEENEMGNKLLFYISPNDLVYLPNKEDNNSNIISNPIDKNRIYKMVSSTTSACFFIKNNIANCIVDKYEFSPLNKMERSITGEMIKETCIPINVDRLGNIKL